MSRTWFRLWLPGVSALPTRTRFILKEAPSQAFWPLFFQVFKPARGVVRVGPCYSFCLLLPAAKCVSERFVGSLEERRSWKVIATCGFPVKQFSSSLVGVLILRTCLQHVTINRVELTSNSPWSIESLVLVLALPWAFVLFNFPRCARVWGFCCLLACCHFSFQHRMHTSLWRFLRRGNMPSIFWTTPGQSPHVECPKVSLYYSKTVLLLQHRSLLFWKCIIFVPSPFEFSSSLTQVSDILFVLWSQLSVLLWRGLSSIIRFENPVFLVLARHEMATRVPEGETLLE